MLQPWPADRSVIKHKQTSQSLLIVIQINYSMADMSYAHFLINALHAKAFLLNLNYGNAGSKTKF